MTAAPTPSTPALAAGNRLPAVDGLRALAMLMVYTYHVWQFAGEPSYSLGSINLLHPLSTFPAGVDLFMVLSGFCLSLPLFRPNGLSKWNAKEYAHRRAWRIIPPYYAAIAYCILLPQLLAAGVKLTGGQAKWQVIPAWWDIAAHFFFVHTLHPATWDGITGAFWSLGLEAQFYLTFPLVIFSAKRIGMRPTIIAMILLSILYRILTSLLLAHHSPAIQFLATITFAGRWMQFALGIAAAIIVSNRTAARRPLSALQGSLLAGAALALYIFASSPASGFLPHFPTRDLLLGLAFAALTIAACAARGPAAALTSLRPIAFLGWISYSLFLIHQPTAWFFSEMCRRFAHLDGLPRFAALMLLGLPITIAISYLFFRAVELPFLRKPPANARLPKQKSASPSEDHVRESSPAAAQPTGAAV